MNFQILKIVIWPKDKFFDPRVLNFEPGKINVITGASRTGKSAIIPIIDYCLASSDCFIPIDIIRDNVAWYGIVIQTDLEEILIAREVPPECNASKNFYFLRDRVILLPNFIDVPNESLEGIKNILNTISNVPYHSLEDDEGKSLQAKLSFRDIVALLFQNQDIIANQNIMFYKTHAHVHRERLRNWFPFILGAENIELLIDRQILNSKEKILNQKKREYEKLNSLSLSWISKMLGYMNIAKEYGLLEKDLLKDTSREELIEEAKRIIENFPNYSYTKGINIIESNNEILNIDQELENLSTEISKFKRRHKNIEGLKSGLNEYRNSVKKRVERLKISEWLEGITLESQICPVCGSTEHPKTCVEIKKISKAFKNLEKTSTNVARIPESIEREAQSVENSISELIEKKKVLNNRFDYLTAQNRDLQNEFQHNKSMFFFLGQLKYMLEAFESVTDDEGLKKDIEILVEDIENLKRKTDKSEIDKRIFV